MRRLRSLVVLTIALSALTGCGGSSSTAQSNQRGQGAPGAGGPGRGPGGRGGFGAGGPAIPVKAGPVLVRQVTYKIQAVGSLESEELIQVTAQVDGVLASVKFREGDRVTTNTVIALIDPDRYRLEFERAEAAYRSALADSQNAAATLARREALARENLVSAEDLNQTRTANERLAAGVASAKAARDIAAQNLSRSSVKPNHGGVIDTRLVDTGAFVRAGTNLATLVDLTRLRLRFKISETESLRVVKGQAVTFKVAAAGDREFDGTVYHVGEVADPTSRQVEVLAWVKNPGVLKPGFFAEVTVPSTSKKDVTVVPETAIQASDRGFVAFVIEDGKAVTREIEQGLRTGDGYVEILSGLTAGETIVYEGSDRIANGVAVTTDRAAPSGGSSRPGGAAGGPPGGRRPGGGGAAGGNQPGGRR